MLINHFDLVTHTHHNEELHLYLEERNVVPQQVINPNLIANGFHKEMTIEDFPRPRKTVYLLVKRRRWLDKETSADHSKRLESSSSGNSHDRKAPCFF